MCSSFGPNPAVNATAGEFFAMNGSFQRGRSLPRILD